MNLKKKIEGTTFCDKRRRLQCSERCWPINYRLIPLHVQSIFIGNLLASLHRFLLLVCIQYNDFQKVVSTPICTH